MGDARFERLCEDNYEMVVRVAFLITGDPHEAEDIAQETFTRAFERWDQVRGMENPVGWLNRVAANLAISRRRRLTRRLRPLSDRERESDTTVDPALSAALRRLTPSQRAVVVLRYYLDMSIDATADALGKRAGTVRALSAQGVARLREDLGESWLMVRDE